MTEYWIALGLGRMKVSWVDVGVVTRRNHGWRRLNRDAQLKCSEQNSQLSNKYLFLRDSETESLAMLMQMLRNFIW